jgi:aspartate ammonia-lyase
MSVFESRCVSGIVADAERCRELLERSTALATALSPYIGYAKTAEVAKESVRTGRPIREIVVERGLLDAAEAERVLSPEAMTQPGIAGRPPDENR